MPYNTRRKSLSLPSLGIHIPMTQAERAAAAAAAAALAAASRSEQIASISESIEGSEPHPAKKLKRSHGLSPSSRLRDDADRRAPFSQRTPPPSPTHETAVDMECDLVDGGRPKVDLEGISDEIVEATIVQLQETGNRPHLVKELATVLSQRLPSVQHSPNPCAIISSRLSTYLKRTCWSAIAPCPLGKELASVHPRRTYFYLTTYPRQPLPETPVIFFNQRSILSPSISSAASRSDDGELDMRRELSPSPEIDLSPDLDDGDEDVVMPSTPIITVPIIPDLSHAQREASPPLDKDEREFTQTADGLQKRKLGGERMMSDTPEQSMEVDDAGRDEPWFGDGKNLGIGLPVSTVLSPAMRPSFQGVTGKKDAESEGWQRASRLFEWDVTPENIELEELDCLLDAC